MNMVLDVCFERMLFAMIGICLICSYETIIPEKQESIQLIFKSTEKS